jgi:hypothetical protein
MDQKSQNRISQSRRSCRTSGSRYVPLSRIWLMIEPRIANHEIGLPPQRCRSQGLLLHKRREGTSSHDENKILTDNQKDEVYLNLVLEFVPETVYRASRHYSKLKQVMPMLQVKLYMYQVSTPPVVEEVLIAAAPIIGIHPLCGNLPSRHQTPESFTQPRHWYSHAM